MRIKRDKSTYFAVDLRPGDYRLLEHCVGWEFDREAGAWRSDIEGVFQLAPRIPSACLEEATAAALARYKLVRGRIAVEDDRFVYRGPYYGNLADKLSGVGWTRNYQRNRWETPDPRKALSVQLPKTAEAEGLVGRKFRLERQRIAESLTASSEVEIPRPAGLEYLPYQKAGIAIALRRGSVLLGDEMGLGKTVQAIGVINADDSINRVLVVCPAALRLNWAREIKRWLVRPMDIGIADGGRWPWYADIIILNYDVLHRHLSRLREREWDLLIADEAHYLKSSSARRTKALFGSGRKRPPMTAGVEAAGLDLSMPSDAGRKEAWPVQARRKLLLTGTPMLNRPVELWPLLHYLDPESWPSFIRFAERYCGHNTRGGRFRGASNLDELARRLRATVLIRRLKRDVLTELPPKRRQIILLPAESLRSLVNEEKRIWDAGKQTLAGIRAKVQVSRASESQEAYREAVGRMRVEYGQFLSRMSKIRHDTAMAIAPMVAEHAASVLENEAKLVLFCHHQDVAERLARALAGFNPVVAHGGHEAAIRQRAVDRFQKEEKVRLFIGTIYAMGTGHTLTAASTVVFAEIDWVPAAISQAEDRLHRIGQASPVLAQHLVVDGSIGALMAETIVRKQEIIDRAMFAGRASAAAEIESDAARGRIISEMLGLAEEGKMDAAA